MKYSVQEKKTEKKTSSAPYSKGTSRSLGRWMPLKCTNISELKLRQPFLVLVSGRYAYKYITLLVHPPHNRTKKRLHRPYIVFA